MYPCCLTKTDWTLSYITGRTKFSLMKQSMAFHEGIRRVSSRLSAGSGTSGPDSLAYYGGAWVTCIFELKRNPDFSIVQKVCFPDNQYIGYAS